MTFLYDNEPVMLEDKLLMFNNAVSFHSGWFEVFLLLKVYQHYHETLVCFRFLAYCSSGPWGFSNL